MIWIEITHTRGWYLGLWGHKVCVIPGEIVTKSGPASVWILAADEKKGIKRFVYGDDAQVIENISEKVT